jgi:hypothetical protein
LDSKTKDSKTKASALDSKICRLTEPLAKSLKKTFFESDYQDDEHCTRIDLKCQHFFQPFITPQSILQKASKKTVFELVGWSELANSNI